MDVGTSGFQFYIFDFTRGIDGRYLLTKRKKNLLKAHRIYLYRDGVRVYPYGDPEDDWLNMDVSRGTGRAGDFFSNNQVIGWIEITQEGNLDLRDKTNREGLIETGRAAEDFVFLIKTFFSYIKQGAFLRYQEKQRQKNVAKSVREGAVAEQLVGLKTTLEEAGETERAGEVSMIAMKYRQEREFLARRAEMTEDLAGVGLSVEMASHDIMLLMGRAQEIGLKLRGARGKDRCWACGSGRTCSWECLQQIVSGMRDVQSLFRSSRRRRQVLKVEPILTRFTRSMEACCRNNGITYTKSVVGDFAASGEYYRWGGYAGADQPV